MKKYLVILSLLSIVLFQTGCAALRGEALACGPNRNGITVFGSPDAYLAMCPTR